MKHGIDEVAEFYDGGFPSGGGSRVLLVLNPKKLRIK
jgi:hypothetical protein